MYKKIQGYVVPDCAAVVSELDGALRNYFEDLHEHALDGFDAAPEGLRLRFTGEIHRKLIVRI